MMVFKRKQIVVLALVLMIVVAGYLQYSYKKSSVAANDKENVKLGEAVYVDNIENKDVVEKDAQNEVKKSDKKTEAVTASKQATDFFAQAKLSKQSIRSKDEEDLKSITNDANAAKEIKSKAYEQMMKIVENSDKEMRVETLVKKAGFEEVIALFGDDGSLDVVIKAPSLSSAQAAQISDIASRQAKLEMSKIHIKNIY